MLLPDLEIPAPVDPGAAALLLAPDPTPPAALPNWLETGRTPTTALDAVMFHPAEEIAAALAALRLDELDLQALLEHLAWETGHGC